MEEFRVPDLVGVMIINDEYEQAFGEILDYLDEAVTERRIQTNNGEFSVYEQAGWLQTPGDRYPQKYTLQLADIQSGYSIGDYNIGPSSVIVNRLGNVQPKKVLDLVPTQ